MEKFKHLCRQNSVEPNLITTWWFVEEVIKIYPRKTNFSLIAVSIWQYYVLALCTLISFNISGIRRVIWQND